jgi:hypothetical protein
MQPCFDVREVDLATVAVLTAQLAPRSTTQRSSSTDTVSAPAAPTPVGTSRKSWFTGSRRRLDVLPREPRRHQSHAAIDVVADAAGQTNSSSRSNAATPPIGNRNPNGYLAWQATR